MLGEGACQHPSERRNTDARQRLGRALAIGHDGGLPTIEAGVLDAVASLAADLWQPEVALRSLQRQRRHGRRSARRTSPLIVSFHRLDVANVQCPTRIRAISRRPRAVATSIKKETLEGGRDGNAAQ
jgi:hypothetical protein